MNARRVIFVFVLIIVGILILYVTLIGPYFLSGTTPPVFDYYVSRGYLEKIGVKLATLKEESGSSDFPILKVAKESHAQQEQLFERRNLMDKYLVKRAYHAFMARNYQYNDYCPTNLSPAEVPLIWDTKPCPHRGWDAVLYYDFKVRDVDVKQLASMVETVRQAGGKIREITLELREGDIH